MDLKNFKSIKILKNQSNYKIKLLIKISFFFFFFKETSHNFFSTNGHLVCNVTDILLRLQREQSFNKACIF